MKISSGTGRVHTMSVIHKSSDPQEKVPFVVAIVELSEGVKIMANSTYPCDLQIGDMVLVKFETTKEAMPCLVAERARNN